MKKKIKINILVEGGLIQSIFIDKEGLEDVEIDIFDLDNNPEQEVDWEAATKEQKEFA